jgi:primosomal protein N' (replication factor Y)
VTLVLHRAAGQLRCHHCGYRRTLPTRCDEGCGSVAVARHGTGTERLESELIDGLGSPDFPILRLDSDSASGKQGIAAVLAEFDAAAAGVLLGTQMVAKGHDFPDVTLGVVLDADATLRFPDFRAEERTFAMIAQLAGRAGRGRGGGRVLVQTTAPEAPSIGHAARHHADRFLEGELARRAALRYPPFGELIRVVCSSPSPGAALAAAEAVGEGIGQSHAEVLGPAPLFRLRGRERAQLVIKAPERAPAVRAVGAAVDTVARRRAHRGVAFSVDVDPQ